MSRLRLQLLLLLMLLLVLFVPLVWRRTLTWLLVEAIARELSCPGEGGSSFGSLSSSFNWMSGSSDKSLATGTFFVVPEQS